MKEYVDIYSAQLLDLAADNNDFIPFQFDVELDLNRHPWKDLHPDSTRLVLQGLTPRLEAWKMITVKGEITDTTQFVSKIEPFARTENISLTEDSVSLGAGSHTWRTRIQYPMRDPGGSQDRNYAWVLTLRPAIATARLFIPKQYSTLDDTRPGECGKVLNLKPLLAPIVRDYYIPGRILFTTRSR